MPFFSGNCIDREPCELGDASGRLRFNNGLLCWKWHFYWRTFNVRVNENQKKIYICSRLKMYFSSVYIQWSALTDLLVAQASWALMHSVYSVLNFKSKGTSISYSNESFVHNSGYKGTALFNRLERVRPKKMNKISIEIHLNIQFKQ